MKWVALTFLRGSIALKLNRRGVTAIEYALIASLIALSVIAGATVIGTRLSAIFNTVATGI